ncbi:RNA polymerase sigma factor [Gorillibacterium timonense]|uniref:RNA polymerase sigma factor n=1 Tax=Gorillibacterium timonense TaxID=1689269 RepID=UPI0009E6EF92|nr:sigma-70 family RNA polymerase sigma factor [Gorillibacterium timonense]
MEHAELESLVRQHGKAVYGFCLRLAPTIADAEDLYQETFLKAVERCERLDDSRNPKALLFSIAVGLHRNRRRKAAWRQRIAPTGELLEDAVRPESREQPSGTASPEDILLSREREEGIRTAARKLDDRLQIPLYLHYAADMSIDDIAAALKVPAGTVKSRLHKARKRIKLMLEADDHE